MSIAVHAPPAFGHHCSGDQVKLNSKGARLCSSLHNWHEAFVDPARAQTRAQERASVDKMPCPMGFGRHAP
eukprot:1859555-Pyramimonas_sp.AAC.1